MESNRVIEILRAVRKIHEEHPDLNPLGIAPVEITQAFDHAVLAEKAMMELMDMAMAELVNGVDRK